MAGAAIMSLPILYSFRRCPYAMRARLAVWASGVTCEYREVKLSAKPASMLEISPKGTVPVLHLPDDGVIEQSLEIMLWALQKCDPLGWLQHQDADLIAENDGAFKHDLDRYKYPERHQSDALHHRAEGVAFLSKLDQRIALRGYLAGDGYGLADAAIMPFVRQFSAVDAAWFAVLPLPALHGWLTAQLESEHFGAIMHRWTPWQEGDAPIIFGRSA
jgi:glutathione S-transferase